MSPIVLLLFVVQMSARHAGAVIDRWVMGGTVAHGPTPLVVVVLGVVMLGLSVVALLAPARAVVVAAAGAAVSGAVVLGHLVVAVVAPCGIGRISSAGVSCTTVRTGVQLVTAARHLAVVVVGLPAARNCV